MNATKYTFNDSSDMSILAWLAQYEPDKLPNVLSSAFKLGPIQRSLGITQPIVWLANLSCNFTEAYLTVMDRTDLLGPSLGGRLNAETGERTYPRRFRQDEQHRFDKLQDEYHNLRWRNLLNKGYDPATAAIAVGALKDANENIFSPPPLFALSPRMIVTNKTKRMSMKQVLITYLDTRAHEAEKALLEDLDRETRFFTNDSGRSNSNDKMSKNARKRARRKQKKLGRRDKDVAEDSSNNDDNVVTTTTTTTASTPPPSPPPRRLSPPRQSENATIKEAKTIDQAKNDASKHPLGKEQLKSLQENLLKQQGGKSSSFTVEERRIIESALERNGLSDCAATDDKFAETLYKKEELATVSEKKEESKTDKPTANEPSHEKKKERTSEKEKHKEVADYQYAWCCDYCKTATFPTFAECALHEDKCPIFLAIEQRRLEKAAEDEWLNDNSNSFEHVEEKEEKNTDEQEEIVIQKSNDDESALISKGALTDTVQENYSMGKKQKKNSTIIEGESCVVANTIASSNGKVPPEPIPSPSQTEAASIIDESISSDNSPNTKKKKKKRVSSKKMKEVNLFKEKNGQTETPITAATSSSLADDDNDDSSAASTDYESDDLNQFVNPGKSKGAIHESLPHSPPPPPPLPDLVATKSGDGEWTPVSSGIKKNLSHTVPKKPDSAMTNTKGKKLAMADAEQGNGNSASQSTPSKTYEEKSNAKTQEKNKSTTTTSKKPLAKQIVMNPSKNKQNKNAKKNKKQGDTQKENASTGGNNNKAVVLIEDSSSSSSSSSSPEDVTVNAEVAQNVKSFQSSTIIDYDNRVNDTALPGISITPPRQRDDVLPEIGSSAAPTARPSQSSDSSLLAQNAFLLQQNKYLLAENEDLRKKLGNSKHRSVEAIQRVQLKAYVADTARVAAEEKAAELDSILANVITELVVEGSLRREVEEALSLTSSTAYSALRKAQQQQPMSMLPPHHLVQLGHHYHNNNVRMTGPPQTMRQLPPWATNHQSVADGDLPSLLRPNNQPFSQLVESQYNPPPPDCSHYNDESIDFREPIQMNEENNGTSDSVLSRLRMGHHA